MSTRCVVTFKDSKADGGAEYHVYRHSDGYPGTEHGVVAALANMFSQAKLVWEFPRFEACEAAAGFVAFCKTHGGGIYLSKGPKYHSDLDYHYIVQIDEAYGAHRLYVTVRRAKWNMKTNMVSYQPVKSGSLADVFAQYNAEETAEA